MENGTSQLTQQATCTTLWTPPNSSGPLFFEADRLNDRWLRRLGLTLARVQNSDKQVACCSPGQRDSLDVNKPPKVPDPVTSTAKPPSRRHGYKFYPRRTAESSRFKVRNCTVTDSSDRSPLISSNPDWCRVRASELCCR